MILQTSKNNIKYIAIDACHFYGHNANKLYFSDFIDIVYLGSRSSKDNFNNTYDYWVTRPSEKWIKGIFLGTQEDIDNEIHSKLNSSDPSTFKKVYFDPLCKYPRFKLNSLTNIKRCLDPSKADSIILHKMEFTTYSSKSSISGANKTRDYLILYSAQNNCYYLIDYYPIKLYDSKEWKLLNKYITQYSKDNTSGLHSWASALINGQILPSDCVIFYFGKMILTDDKQTEFLDNLYSKYMKITYDTELDRFINIGLQKPEKEDLETINNMLASSDESVVGMGLKLLTNYNLGASACSIGIIIAQNWGNIIRSSVSRSVGFEQVLATLGLNKDTLNYQDKYSIVNALYDNSTDDIDKAQARNAIISNITIEMRKCWENYEKKFSKLGLSFKFTIE